jgi:phytanoyl-CoA hydroxylase
MLVAMQPAGDDMTATLAAPTTSAERAAFVRDGFHVARGLIPRAEIDALRDYFMGLHARAPIYEVYQPEPASPDPLKQFPRMMQPHRWDRVAKRALLDPRMVGALRELIADEPLAAQSMFYFKPPGADGQGFHQDNFYLMADPGTCYAAWLAIDDADAGNGSLFVEPGSHRGGLATPQAGTAEPWGSIIPQPGPERVVEVSMRAGDCLFFHGNLIHGSHRNASTERWRRSFICHFIGQRSSQRIAAYYHPIFAADGWVADVEAGLELPPGAPGRR